MKPPVILRIYKGSQLVEVKQFQVDQIIFGRDADVQVDIKDEKVSAIHCLIEIRDSGYYVCDLGSESGTFKNGKQVLDEALSSGDEIVIGSHRIQFFVGAPKTTQASASMAPVIPSATPAPAPQEPVAFEDEITEVDYEESKPTPVRVAPAKTVTPPKLPEKSFVPSQKNAGTSSSGKSKKGRQTFAPPSEIADLGSHLKPMKGPVVEIIVAWQERVLTTYHFTSSTKKVVTIGSAAGADIQVPSGLLVQTLPFVELTTGCQVLVSPEMGAQIKSANQTFDADQLTRLGKLTRGGNNSVLRVEQGEMACISAGVLNIYVRFVPDMKRPLLTGLDLSSGELTAFIFAFMVSSLIMLYSTVYAPKPVEEVKEEEQIRIAQFVMNKPPTPPEPKAKQDPETEVPPPPPSTTLVKKVELSDKTESQKGSKTSESKVAAQEKARAQEVRAIPDSKNKPKKFTSTKQGGAVKIADKEGANAQTKDVKNSGLLSAFGGGGIRSKIDTAYSGSGDLLGMANQASGKSGQNRDREGDDIGSQFKDTGAGGKGTATQGISGIGTKGRSSGMSDYGGGVGLGGKSNVTLEIGGTEEASWVGKIDREAVRRVIREHLNQVRSCYERGLQTDTNLNGKVVISFEIEAQGNVRSSRVKTTTLPDTEVGNCIASRLKEWRFPEPPAGVVAVVDYPFAFSAQR